MHVTKIDIRPDRFPTHDRYPYTLPQLATTSSVEFTTPVTLFAGENGSGKSTFLKAIARACGIHIWGELDRTRYEPNPYEDTLHRALDVGWTDGGAVPGSFFDSQTFRNFAKMLDEWASVDPEQFRQFGGESLVTRSHGQSLMQYFESRYRIRGLYFLDEPETALSPRSQIALLDILGRMSAAGHAQFIIASHSPIILACEGAVILSFDHAPVAPIAYENTEHFRVYREFLDGRGNGDTAT